MGNLLFSRGTALVGQLYISGIEFGIGAQVLGYAISNALTYLYNAIVTAHPALSVMNTPSIGISDILASYGALFMGTYASIVVAVWGILFVLFLTLPLIQAGALTVVLPVAIVMRTLAYSGPKLRETSNTFIAFAIGFFFVLPLTIALDSTIANCLTTTGIQSGSCWWINSQYITPISLQIPTPQLFSSTPLTISGLGVSSNLFSSLASNGAAPGIYMLVLLFDAPIVAWNYASKIADYTFLGIVLTGIDFLITLGFIAGFARSLNAISGIFRGERFW